MAHAAAGSVRVRSAQRVLGDLLVRHGFDDLGSVMNMYEVFSTIKMKSVMAGE